MILKWYNANGRWRYLDKVTNLEIVGQMTLKEAKAYCSRLDGQNSLPALQVSHPMSEDSQYPLVSAWFNNEYNHVFMDAQPNMLFIMSDEGKTVDRV